ncbi:MAG: PD-(D/E)XK nuclease family protein [Lachnospiraceae bacterium]|nr:PD-(D/E)XK nuclease family protein [Lachnospiraceae bacterium]
MCIHKELKTIQKTLLGTEENDLTKGTTSEINVFSILGIDYKEVLMCRMLGAILDPRSSMNDGEEERTRNVKLFLEKVLEIEDPCEKTQVILEDRTDYNRRCDILITTAKGCYPIEVKIYAKDQEHQLFDYYIQYFKDIGNTKKIYYLTPSGKDPSENSIGRDGRYLKVGQFCSLGFDRLRNWLQEIQCNYRDGGPKKYLINQYAESINNLLVGNEMDKMIEETKIDDWKSCEVSYAITHILAMDHDQLWRRVVCSYLRNTLEYPEDKYDLVDSNELIGTDEEETDLRVFFVLKRKNPEQQIIKICVQDNLYIYACCEINEQGWRENRWKHVAPDGVKTPYYLKKKGIENCHNYKMKKIDICSAIEDVEKQMAKR